MTNHSEEIVFSINNRQDVPRRGVKYFYGNCSTDPNCKRKLHFTKINSETGSKTKHCSYLLGY